MSENQAPEGQALVDLCATILFEKRAEEVVHLAIEGKSDVCDNFIIATCQSEAQMRAILADMARQLKKAGLRPRGREFEPGVRWAILDLGDMMIHLFEEEHRKHFSLERLYQDVEPIVLNAEDYLKDSSEEREDDTDGYV